LHALGWRLHAALEPAVPPLAPPVPPVAVALPPLLEVVPDEPPLLVSSLLLHAASAAIPTVAEAPVTTRTLKNLLMSMTEG
jgi:hypothetical protein